MEAPACVGGRVVEAPGGVVQGRVANLQPGVYAKWDGTFRIQIRRAGDGNALRLDGAPIVPTSASTFRTRWRHTNDPEFMVASPTEIIELKGFSDGMLGHRFSLMRENDCETAFKKWLATWPAAQSAVAPPSLSPQRLAHFARTGFLVRRNCFPDTVVTAVQGMLRISRGAATRRLELAAGMETNPELLRWCLHPLAPLLAQLFGCGPDEVELPQAMELVLINSAPDTAAVDRGIEENWEIPEPRIVGIYTGGGDGRAVQPEQGALDTASLVVTIFLTATDVGGSGHLVMSPGSHLTLAERLGELLPAALRFTDERRWEDCRATVFPPAAAPPEVVFVPPGSLVVQCGSLVHGWRPRTAQKPTVALVARVVSPARRQGTATPVDTVLRPMDELKGCLPGGYF